MAGEYRVDLRRNGNPRAKKRAVQGGRTFKEFAEEHYPSWCKGLHKDEPKAWERSIRDVPSLHNLKLREITTDDVFKALKPLWGQKPVTAPRIRQRIERVLDAAKALKLRSGENAAAWRGNLKVLLPSVRKIHKKKPHTSSSAATSATPRVALKLAF